MAKMNNRNEQSAFLWLITLTMVVVAVILLACASFMKQNLPALGPIEMETSSQSSPSAPSVPSSQADQESSTQPPESTSSQSSPGGQSSSTVPSGSGSLPVGSKVPSDPGKLTISQAGTYDTPHTYRQIIISVGGVSLKNKVIEGDLFILDSVGSQEIQLENVEVRGNIYLYGGDPVTMVDVTAPNLRIQRDAGAVPLTLVGDTTIDRTLVMCNATLREKNMQGDGFVTLQVEDGGILSRINLTLMSVRADTLISNFDSRVTLSSGAVVKELQANMPMTVAGKGELKNLVVRNDRVQYEQKPENITVKRGYDAPVQIMGQYAPDDEDGEGTLDTRIQLDQPSEVYLYEENGALCVDYSHVSGNNGYYIAVYVNGRQQEVLYTQLNEESFLIDDDISKYQGERLYVRVKALGDSYDDTRDSKYQLSNTLKP